MHILQHCSLYFLPVLLVNLVKLIAFFFAKAGLAVINASESGISFPLKRRDQLLDYILTLMGCDDDDGYASSSVEHLHTQV